MSITILALAKSFSSGRLTSSEFSNAYIELWRFERDNNLLQKDESSLSECLSSIFCVADLYNPDADREEYELDDEQLLSKVI
ncbi:colicin immunity protein [Bacterioplanes sanyensis]|uniref:colicin immunity domain-containing protein n=1 Tax=Bacterioplanes sanyensis TaxID=1249553 RepID=UPI001676A222|nr:colicin immunity domain-containing protein [Bacterioplanes sanyensis]GGY45672.1 colicin immunity protein [Bacterioplanes sanyensis]